MSSKSFYSSIISFLTIWAISAGFILPVQPVLAAQKVVAIDAGHGSVKDSRTDEGPIELSEAFKLKTLLEKDGYKVVMTRTKNGQSYGVTGAGIDAQHSELAKRAEIANNAGADLVVSIHSDAHKRDQFSIIYPDTANVKDRLGHVVQRNSSYLETCKKIAEIFYSKMKSGGFVPNSDRPLHGEARNNTSRTETIGMPLALTAHLKAPNITVEVFGHESETNMQKYAKQETQLKVAQALESAVNSYFAIAPKQTPQDPPADTTSSKNTPDTPKKDRSDKCPKEAPASGPSIGKDFQEEIAKQFDKEQSARSEAANGSNKCKFDESAEQAIVNEAMKYAPGTDGKTKIKYTSGGRSPSSGFDCSGFVKYVLQNAKASGADINVPTTALSTAQASVGQVIDKIDIAKFTLPNGGARLRTKADMPKIEDLRPGDIIFFGTATQYSDKKKSPNVIGHVGIYLGNGKYIESTTSDHDLNKDSASSANPTSDPPFTAHPQGSQYKDYNGVKISDLYDSYFTPGLYIQVNRVTKPKDCESGTTYANVDFGRTANPGGANASISFSSCHGSSVCHPAEDSGHGAYQNRPNGDAVDITPPSGYAYAVFDGNATKGGSGRDSYTAVRSLNGRAVAYYYHTNNVATGSVKAGQQIAKTGASGIGHIHFELLVDGKSVHGNTNKVNAPSAYVQSLWKNMQNVLGLAT